DIKQDRAQLNEIVATAIDTSDAYAMANEGTALHKSTELADYAGGRMDDVPEAHREKVGLYLDTLAQAGLKVTPGMIERRIVSLRYDVAGTFDRILTHTDGRNAVADVKTGDSLDLSFPGIAAQLSCYEDGINMHGVWDGSRYNMSVAVDPDYAIVIHLP